MDLESLEAANQSLQADLKLAFKRIGDLQAAIEDEMESDEEADVVLEGVLEPRLAPRPPPGSLTRVNGAGLAPSLHSPGREGSVQRLLSSLRSDPRHSLALPPGGVEEHGPAVTL